MMPHRALDPESGTRDQLLKVDWEDVGVRLTAYAVWKARNLRWRTGQPQLLAAGKTPEDVAAEAVLKVIEGTRVWDPQRGPLLPYLRRVVDSLLNQLAQGADNRMQQRLAPDAEGALAAEHERHAGARIEALRTALTAERRDDLLAVLDAVSFSCEPKPREIAGCLGTTVADVNNRLKRLRRFAQKLVASAPRRKSATRSMGS